MESRIKKLKAGDKVTCNGGFKGTVLKVCEWSPGMIEVRLARGVVCIPDTDAEKEMTVSDALKEMMEVWNRVEAAAREFFPNANEEEIYRIVADKMNESLGLKKGK